MATRVAQLVLEVWKSTGGDAAYDPLTLDMGFAAAEPEESADYVITLDRQTFFVQLVRNDVDQDDVAGITLREIRVMVKWRKDYSRGAVVSSDPSLALTTYVRRDTD
jgi:hypothetical protein